MSSPVIDFHTHLFPKSIRENRARFFEGEPAFRSLYGSPDARMAGAADLISAMDEDGVQVSLVFGFPWKNIETARRHNDYILEAVLRHPDRLMGLCCLDPGADPAGDEVRRCLDGGLSGVGELAFYDAGLDQRALESLAPAMEICRNRDRPVLIHVNEPIGHAYSGKMKITLAQIEALVRRFPENRIVLAHWGGGLFFFHLLKKQIKKALEKVYFDTAASPFLYDPAIYRVAVDILGDEKILFGSDFPLIRPKRYFKEMATAGLTFRARAGIIGKNAARLLKLES